MGRQERWHLRQDPAVLQAFCSSGLALLRNGPPVPSARGRVAGPSPHSAGMGCESEDLVVPLSMKCQERATEEKPQTKCFDTKQQEKAFARLYLGVPGGRWLKNIPNTVMRMVQSTSFA